MANIKPKKHLGQHFLKDENIASKIVNALVNEKNLPVLEIGPGTGMLTKYFINSNNEKFYALDVDHESISYLKEKYPNHSKRFIVQNYLTYDVSFSRFSIIGNFPYNISSQIFFKIWDDRDKVDEVVCMLQKEVADRICSKYGNRVYGILSVLLQTFFEIEYLFEVSSRVFNPPPKIRSSVIRLKRNDVVQLPCDERVFMRVVKAGFGKRRKTLRNALKSLNLPKSVTDLDVMDQRAEQLSVQEFISLTEKIS